MVAGLHELGAPAAIVKGMAGYSPPGSRAAGSGQDGAMTRLGGSAALPVIDVAPLAGAAAGTAAAVPAPVTAEALAVAGQIQAACRERGFFYVTGHGVPSALVEELA
jgi:hypothetical protein